MTWPGAGLALLEKTNSRSWDREMVLRPGERCGNIEVCEVDSKSVRARIYQSGASVDVTLSLPALDEKSVQPVSPAAAFVHLDHASANLVIQIYGELIDRTLLRGHIPVVPLTFGPTHFASLAEVPTALNKCLLESGIFIRTNRDKFALLVTREKDFAKVTTELWESVLRLSVSDAGSNAVSAAGHADSLPAGVINFPNTDVNQVLRVFEEVIHRTVIRPTSLPAPTIYLRTQTPLTRTEAAYAFAATLALNDLSLQPAGERFLLVFPAWDSERVRQLVARVKARPTPPGGAGNPATFEFPGTDLSQVAGVYEQLLGEPVELPAQAPRPVLVFRSQEPLPREAALYGLELLFGVNGLSVVPQENGPGMKLIPTAAL